MNCRPGDMAVIVRGTNLGVFVEVLCVSQHYGWPYWRVRSAWPVRRWFPDGSSEIGTISSIHDARLRPIRPDAEPSEIDVPAEPAVDRSA